MGFLSAESQSGADGGGCSDSAAIRAAFADCPGPLRPVKKTRELLTELNHPYVNWEYVLKELKSISIGDFYVYNNHPEGLAALSILLTIYFDILKSPASQDIN